MKKRFITKILSFSCCTMLTFNILSAFPVQAATNTKKSKDDIRMKLEKSKDEFKAVDSKDKIKVKFIGKNVKSNLGDVHSTENIVTLVDKSYIDSNSDTVTDILKEDLNNSKYIVVYGENIKNNSINDIAKLMDIDNNVKIQAKDNAAKNLEEKIVAYGFSKDSNGNVIYDSYYNDKEDSNSQVEKNIDMILDGAKSSLISKESTFNTFTENDKFKVQDVNDSPDYTYTNTIDFGDYGKLQSTSYMEKVSDSSYVNGQYVSVWDIKQSNTTVGGYSLYGPSWWCTDYLYTRISTESYYPTQQIIDHGPGPTERQSTASIGLDSSGPSVGWSYSTGDVSITDNYNPPYYGRWIHDYKRGSSAAKAAYKSQPGVRATNGSGNFIIELSNVVTFWDAYWGGSDDLYTGVWQYVVPDR